MLSRNHIHILKRVKKHKEIRSEKHHKDLDYLYKQGYIEMTVYDTEGEYFSQPYLTELGEARLYENRRKFIEVWLPVAISNLIAVCALVISIVALLK